MIIVTGATGHLGRAIVEKLVDRAPVNQWALASAIWRRPPI